MTDEQRENLAKAIALMTAWDIDEDNPHPTVAALTSAYLNDSNPVTTEEMAVTLTQLLTGMFSLAGLLLLDVSRAKNCSIPEVLQHYGHQVAGDP